MACAPLVNQLPWWVIAVFVGSVAWRYLIERFQVYRPGRFARYVVVVLVVVATYAEYRGLLGRDPGLALLVMLLGLKLLELRNRRDVMLMLFISYVVLLGGFLYEQTMLGALWALATVVISLAALIRLHQALAPAALLRLAGSLVLKAIPLLLILYVFFPRVGGALWQLPRDSHSGLTGMSDDMRPGSINELAQSAEIALRVDFVDGTPPRPAELYWRGLVLSESDGRRWTRSTRTARSATPVQPLAPPVQYRVTLEPSNKRWLFALDLPVTTPPEAQLRADYTLVHIEPVKERISYDVVSHTRYTTGELAPAERVATLALPPTSARVRAFADTLRAPHADDAAVVQALLAHFRRENFVYTLTPPLLGADPVDEFLFETRRGFCEHYAGAFVTLMRAAGVPARVVIGYQGGELNPTGNYLIVRQSDAHAWAEVWLPQRGWTRVDPTAAIAPERIELGIDAIRRLEARGLAAGSVGADMLARALELPWFERAWRRTRLYWDYTNLAWYRWVIDYRKERQEGLLHKLGFEHIDWPRVLIIVGAACLAVLLGYAAWSRRPPAPDPAQRLYARFCRRLARIGLARAAHEGPLDFARRAGKRRPDLAPAIDAVTQRYIAVRYGEETGVAGLRQALRTFRVRRRAPPASRDATARQR